MAEGLLRHDAGETFEVSSAGTKPSHVRPEAIQVMQEIGIDIRDHRSKHVSEFSEQPFDYVITVCDNAKETCPLYPVWSRTIHRSFPDPAAVGVAEEERLASFRLVRDDIRHFLADFRDEVS